MVMTILTAKQARQLSESSELFDELMCDITDAALEGLTSIKTRKGEFGSGAFYTHDSTKWPVKESMIMKKFRDLGYKVEMRSEERQFVDMWLEISW
jgi:hypothetical protein